MKFVAVMSFVLLMVTQAQAETIVINRPNGPGPAPAVGQRVTVNITLSSPAPAAAAASNWASNLAAANQSLYDIVGRECGVLSSVLNGDCRLVQISTTGNVNDRPTFGMPQPGAAGSINVNATVTFEVEPKAPSAPGPTK